MSKITYNINKSTTGLVAVIQGQELQDTKQELEEAKREIAKLKASSNENYWEVLRQRDNMLYALHKIADAVRYGFKHSSQRDNMLYALHKIADAVRYGFKHGSKSGEEVK